MYKIRTLNAISEIGISKFREESFTVSENIDNPDGIMLRSFDMHNLDLNENLLGVARAGAGTNNIPIDKCSEQGIAVFNTPGANANAVKELVITALLMSSRKILDSIEWSKTLKGQQDIEKLVEKGKSAFSGPEILGKKLGVIGLGAIGVLVANTAHSLGMKVIGYDPFLSLNSAWSVSSSVERATSVEEVVAKCDYVTMHVPLNSKTENMFNTKLFEVMKKDMRLLNFSRSGLVNNNDLEKAINEGIVASYITDFPTEQLIGMKNVITIPHLGASTPESEENCAEMAALELKAYLEYGTIINSVNLPDCDAPYTGKKRVTIVHKNIPTMVSNITTVFGNEHINIDNMTNKSRGNWAYTLVDCDDLHGKNIQLLKSLSDINGVVKVRVVREC